MPWESDKFEPYSDLHKLFVVKAKTWYGDGAGFGEFSSLSKRFVDQMQLLEQKLSGQFPDVTKADVQAISTTVAEIAKDCRAPADRISKHLFETFAQAKEAHKEQLLSKQPAEAVAGVAR